jgi:hypothetical protein
MRLKAVVLVIIRVFTLGALPITLELMQGLPHTILVVGETLGDNYVAPNIHGIPAKAGILV